MVVLDEEFIAFPPVLGQPFLLLFMLFKALVVVEVIIGAFFVFMVNMVEEIVVVSCLAWNCLRVH